VTLTNQGFFALNWPAVMGGTDCHKTKLYIHRHCKLERQLDTPKDATASKNVKANSNIFGTSGAIISWNFDMRQSHYTSGYCQCAMRVGNLLTAGLRAPLIGTA
jgi:hypothetical protein